MKRCTAPACEAPLLANGWCKAHYSKNERDRDRNRTPRPGTPPSTIGDGVLRCVECGRPYTAHPIGAWCR